MSQKHTLSVLVENEFGVLARVAGMFAARGYNIDSLSVGPTSDPKFSHMTIVTHGNEGIIEQILKQLNRLVDVIKAEDLTAEKFIQRETVLIRVELSSEGRPEILKIVDSFKVSILEKIEQTLTLELTAETQKIDAFLNAIKVHKILQLARTGTIAIPKGD